ncbi:MAG: hypothetical protein F6K17_00560 [Okeania sp. SIO3C4]|nr:hypothetical protein [Okeania sp. SIO3C4]
MLCLSFKLLPEGRRKKEEGRRKKEKYCFGMGALPQALLNTGMIEADTGTRGHGDTETRRHGDYS